MGLEARASKRRLLAAIAAIGAALAVLSTASAEQAKYGGVLVVVQANGQVGTLDPAMPGGTGSSGEILTVICEGMYSVDKKNNPVPQLATSMPAISANRLTYTVQLRQGIVFNDGTPFNAQAVVTSYQRYIALAPGTGGALSYIASVTAAGPNTVVFQLKSRFSPFQELLGSCIMSPTQIQKLGSNFGTDPIGVGPFMFDSQVPGTSVTVIKSPYYYNKYAVHLDKIVFQNAPDSATAAADLEAGDAQVDDFLGAGDLDGVQANKGFALIQQATTGFTALRINVGNANGLGNPPGTVNSPLAQSPKLRQAFEEAINRAALAKVVAPTVQAGCTFIPPGTPDYDTALKCTPYNPTDAKKLVAASGIPNPTVQLLTSNGSRPVLVSQFIQSEEAAVGINVVITVNPLATVLAQVFAGNYQMAIFGDGGVDNYPGLNLLSEFGTKASGNYSGFSSPQLDLILANYFKSTSTQSQKTLMAVAEQILASQRPYIVLYHAINFLAYNTAVTGIQAVNGILYRLAFAQYTG